MINKTSIIQKKNIIEHSKKYLIYITLIILLLVAQIIIPGFLQPENLVQVLKLASFTGIAAIGQTLVILLAGIDMSIGNVITLANLIAAQMMNGDDSMILSTLAIVMIIGALIGVGNAAGILVFKVPPMIMTLGLGTVVQGIALLYSKGAPKGNAAPMLRTFVNEKSIGGIISGLVFGWIVLTILIVFMLKKTTFSRKVYATGTNEKAAYTSGIKIKRIKVMAYIISGIFAAITGLILVGYTGTAQTESGASYSMNTIVAVVLGGTSMQGGKGGYLGTVIGAIILSVIDSMLTVVNIPISGRMIIQGIIIVIMVLVYGREEKRFAK
jgi:ribose transport system permease protein